MVIFTVKLSMEKGVLCANFHMSFWSLIIFAVVLLITDDLQLPETASGWTGAILAGVSFAFAYLTFFAAANIIGISRVAMISFIEPVFTILLAMVLFQEALSIIQWGGVGLVAVGLFIMETPKDFFKFKSR
jgi:transporter family protein